MQYTRDSKIENLIDVVHFFEYLLYEKKLSFHPDDDFSEYVNYEDNNPCFTSGEAEICNLLMDQCFEVCQKQDQDIYNIGLASMRRILRPDVEDPIDKGMLARRIGQDQIYKIVEDIKDGYVLSSLSDDITLIVKESDIVLI